MEDEDKQIEKEEIPHDWKSIYVMESENGAVKIGISKNVKKRKRNIESGGVITIVSCYKTAPCSNPYEIERIMHKKFKDYRIKGEWFSCEMTMAISALDKVFKEKALFHVKTIGKTALDYYAECVNKEIASGKQYVESLENALDFFVNEVSEKKNKQIERLISMVESLQMELKIKNEELEKYENFEEVMAMASENDECERKDGEV